MGKDLPCKNHEHGDTMVMRMIEPAIICNFEIKSKLVIPKKKS